MHFLIAAQIRVKVPKRENFSLAFFTLINPILVCDLGARKKAIFYHLAPVFIGFGFFTACRVFGKKHFL
jgi:hypothetical protein